MSINLEKKFLKLYRDRINDHIIKDIKKNPIIYNEELKNQINNINRVYYKVRMTGSELREIGKRVSKNSRRIQGPFNFERTAYFGILEFKINEGKMVYVFFPLLDTPSHINEKSIKIYSNKRVKHEKIIEIIKKLNLEMIYYPYSKFYKCKNWWRYIHKKIGFDEENFI